MRGSIGKGTVIGAAVIGGIIGFIAGVATKPKPAGCRPLAAIISSAGQTADAGVAITASAAADGGAADIQRGKIVTPPATEETVAAKPLAPVVHQFLPFTYKVGTQGGFKLALFKGLANMSELYQYLAILGFRPATEGELREFARVRHEVIKSRWWQVVTFDPPPGIGSGTAFYESANIHGGLGVVKETSYRWWDESDVFLVARLRR